MEKKNGRHPWEPPKPRVRTMGHWDQCNIPRRLDRRTWEPYTTSAREMGTTMVEVPSQTLYPTINGIFPIECHGFTTELHYAAHDNSEERILAALKKGYDIEAKDAYGRTPLLRAALKGNVEAFMLLLKHGADLYAKDYYKRCCGHLAAKGGHLELWERILELTDGEALYNTDNYGRTAFHLAMLKGRKEMVYSFLSHQNCDINAKDSWYRTPLHLVYKEKYPRLAKFLEKHGADTESVEIFGKTPNQMGYW